LELYRIYGAFVGTNFAPLMGNSKVATCEDPKSVQLVGLLPKLSRKLSMEAAIAEQ
jgi:hypothetical protein